MGKSTSSHVCFIGCWYLLLVVSFSTYPLHFRQWLSLAIKRQTTTIFTLLCNWIVIESYFFYWTTIYSTFSTVNPVCHILSWGLIAVLNNAHVFPLVCQCVVRPSYFVGLLLEATHHLPAAPGEVVLQKLLTYNRKIGVRILQMTAL